MAWKPRAWLLLFIPIIRGFRVATQRERMSLNTTLPLSWKPEKTINPRFMTRLIWTPATRQAGDSHLRT